MVLPRTAAVASRALTRGLATATPSAASSGHHKVLVVGAGTGGITVAAQLARAFKAEGRELAEGDIAVVDPAEWHHYQPGWTLVGSGLADKQSLRRPAASLVPEGVAHVPLGVKSFAPNSNTITTSEGTTLSYDYLVVAPGLSTNWGAVSGLQDALVQQDSGVSSIYAYDTADKTWRDVQKLSEGKAIFTQPAGIIKCAGAPQKVMWMAHSTWKNANVRDAIQLSFATGAPTMFGVPKYSKALERLRVERDVEGLFEHNLVSVDAKRKAATFKRPDGTTIEREFDLLHVTPPQGPLEFVKNSPLADAAGWVSVDPATTQHTKFANVFSLGDASSMPNSKTAAAITSQAPVLVHNLRAAMDGKKSRAAYDGYASCPLLTGHNELMLCEFKYGGVPKETFAPVFGSQDVPRRAFYHLKKDFFPVVYWNNFVKGTWFGPSGPIRPTFD